MSHLDKRRALIVCFTGLWGLRIRRTPWLEARWDSLFPLSVGKTFIEKFHFPIVFIRNKPNCYEMPSSRLKSVEDRQGTSSQYQNSYLDLAVWYCICPLNQNINKYWNGNATYPKSMFFIMWSSGWRVLWNDFLNTCDAIAIVLLWMSCPAFNSYPLFSEKFLEHRFLFKAIISFAKIPSVDVIKISN